MLKKFSKHNKGYTIIETMISVSVFLVVILAGTSTLLQANVLHQKSQDMRSIMDSLSFMIEEMSRDLRTGTNYRCITSANGGFNPSPPNRIDTALSGASCSAIAFESTFGDDTVATDQWIYKVESTNGGVTYNISRSTDGGTSWVQLNPSEVVLDGAISPFSVLGAPVPPGDTQQPLVMIRLVGNITYKGVVSPFSLQTSVSQRLVDL